MKNTKKISTYDDKIHDAPDKQEILQYRRSKGEWLKGGYIDFSHLTELEKIYITEIYMKKKKKKSSVSKNYKFTFFNGVPLKGYVASSVIFRFCSRNK